MIIILGPWVRTIAGNQFYEVEDMFETLNKIDILEVDNIEIGSYIRNTLQLDKARSREEALFRIKRNLIVVTKLVNFTFYINIILISILLCIYHNVFYT